MQCPHDRLLSSHLFLGDDVERISMRSGVVESGVCVVRKVGRRRWRKRIVKCFMIGGLKRVADSGGLSSPIRTVAATDKNNPPIVYILIVRMRR